MSMAIGDWMSGSDAISSMRKPGSSRNRDNVSNGAYGGPGGAVAWVRAVSVSRTATTPRMAANPTTAELKLGSLSSWQPVAGSWRLAAVSGRLADIGS